MSVKHLGGAVVNKLIVSNTVYEKRFCFVGPDLHIPDIKGVLSGLGAT